MENRMIVLSIALYTLAAVSFGACIGSFIHTLTNNLMPSALFLFGTFIGAMILGALGEHFWVKRKEFQKGG